MDKEKNERMKIAIIVAYFGTLPSYFQVFLDSCRMNRNFDWLIFTNDTTEYNYPSNVHQIVMSFNECRQAVQKRFSFPVALKTPQKLCDYKCAYGYIFEDYLKDYDWWGHCDLDQIFGDLSVFVTEDRLNTLDKIYSLGHLTLYRNTDVNNRIFMSELNGETLYKNVFTSDRGMGFDEWLPGNINEIFLSKKVPALYENDGADIEAYHMAFVLTDYDVAQRKYTHSSINNSIFLWEKGKLYQLYIEHGKLKRREFPYIHLQKRKMKDNRKLATSESFYIVPNCFVDGTEDPVALLKRSQIWTVINPQYFKVKYQSLKYRIKSGDWIRRNVFKQSN